MMILAPLLLLICISAKYTIAQEDNKNRFTYPPADAGLIDFPAFSQVELKWTCTDCGNDHVWLRVWQRRDNNTFASEAISDDHPVDDNTNASYLWQSRLLEDLTINNTFHFQVNYPNLQFISGNMRMVASSVSSTPTPPVTISATPNLSTSNSPTTGTAILTDSNLTTLSRTPSSSDGTLKVGLGVGLGLGIPSLLILCGLAGYLLRQRRFATPMEKGHEKSDEDVTIPMFAHTNAHSLPQELPEWRGEMREPRA